MVTAQWAAAISVAALPPLTDEQTIRLNTAHDGRDHQEEAFSALAENLRLWPIDAIDQLPTDTPVNPIAWSDATETHRGELCIISGSVEQVTQLAPPYDTVFEYFIRPPLGKPVIVYILKTPELPEPELHVALKIPARFYKTVNFVARDNNARIYPAFIGIHFRIDTTAAREASSSNSYQFLTWLLGVILFLFVVLIFIRARVVRAQRAARLQQHARASLEHDSIASSANSDESAAALERLRRGAE